MSKNYFTAILYGWITCLLLICLASAVIALMISFITITEMTLAFVTLAIGLLTLFTSGMIAGLKAKEKGWLIGLSVAFGFVFFTFLVQYIGMQSGFSWQQVIYHSTYTLAAIVGSILGVNIGQYKNN